MRFAFGKLTHHYNKQAHNILTRSFSRLPIQVEGQTKFPKYTISEEEWSKFWHIYIDHCCENSLSSAVFDLEKDRKLVGTFVVRDIMVMNSALSQFLEKQDSPFLPLMGLLGALDDKAKGKCPHLFKEKTTADLWGIAIDPEYQGFKLADGLTKEAIRHVAQDNFKYVSMETFNGAMGKICSNNRFSLDAEIDAKDYEFNGVKPFAQADVFHRTVKFWSKELA